MAGRRSLTPLEERMLLSLVRELPPRDPCLITASGSRASASAIENDGRLGTHTLRKTWARKVYKNSGNDIMITIWRMTKEGMLHPVAILPGMLRYSLNEITRLAKVGTTPESLSRGSRDAGSIASAA
jgi:hypothetical protein